MVTSTLTGRVRAAAPPRRHLRGALQVIGRGTVGAALAALVLGAVVVTGSSVAAREGVAGAPGAAPVGGWPAPAATSPNGEVVVAVVLGRSGTVASDVLAPYEVFARSAAFSVYTVGEHAEPVPLTGGASLVPAHTFDDVDSGRAPRPDVVVVPAVGEPTGERERAMRSWIAAQAAAGARVLGVCSGSEVLAATGVLDGHRATSHWSGLASLREEHPDVDWVGGQRWVEDDRIVTTAGVSSGIPGALAVVRDLAGPAEAQRVGRDLGYPGWELDGSTGIPERRFTIADTPLLLNAVLPWGRPAVALGLTDGVGEIDLAAALEVYSMSGAARTVAVAASPAVTTRHGVVLTTVPTRSAPDDVARVVVPGADDAGEVDPALARWAVERGIAVQPITSQDGRRGFDAALAHVSRTSGAAMARSVAKMVDYPIGGLDLGAGTSRTDLRAPMLAALTLVLAVSAGLFPTAVHRARRRRAALRRGAVS